MEKDCKSEFWTVAETASFLRLAKITVYRLVERREIVHYRVGTKIMFLKSDIDSFIRESKVEKES